MKFVTQASHLVKQLSGILRAIGSADAFFEYQYSNHFTQKSATLLTETRMSITSTQYSNTVPVGAFAGFFLL